MLYTRYAEKGYRVIAIGKRELPRSVKIYQIEHYERTQVEDDLEFLGLIVFENRYVSAGVYNKFP